MKQLFFAISRSSLRCTFGNTPMLAHMYPGQFELWAMRLMPRLHGKVRVVG